MTKSNRKITCLIIISALITSFTMTGCKEPLLKPSPATKHNSLNTLEPKAIQILQQGLNDPQPRIRVNAVEVVARTGYSKLMPRVQTLLTDPYVPVRFAAAIAVGDTCYRFARQDIKNLLNDPDQNVRIAAEYAIDKLDATNDFSMIGRAITSEDQTVRANAAFILGKAGNIRAPGYSQTVSENLKLLQWVQSDKNSTPKVIFQAMEARAKLGDQSILRQIWSIAYSTRADDRLMAIRALGALGTPKARDILETKLDDEVLEVRLVAAEQLGTLKDNTGKAEVIDVFEKKLTSSMTKDDRERVEVLSALAIGSICSADLTGYLPALTDNDSIYVRIAAANAVLNCLARK